MQIGLLGLIFHAGNKGCLALSYSFLEILNLIAKKHNETINVKIFSTFPTKKLANHHFHYKNTMQEFMPVTKYRDLNLGFTFYRAIGNRFLITPDAKKCDYIFDFTAGDSFTDLYGSERFYSRTRLKKRIIDSGVPLVLGSQTIGPFTDPAAEQFAVEVIRLCKEVYVRDELSYHYTKEISGRVPKLTTDIAFLLPFKRKEKNPSSIRVGFNPSGLLWNEGEKYGLTVDYKRYCRQILGALTANQKYEVHLIAHAYSKVLLEQADNDYSSLEQLKKEFPQVIAAPYYETPMEIKSYISGMDVFLGARMHAAVAAFSAEVAVIPFSYSRKFEGLFGSLGYDYLVHGCSETTEIAVEKTLKWIETRSELEESVLRCTQNVNMKTEQLITDLDQLLYRK